MICSKCSKDKDESEFHFKKTENRYNSWCKPCLHSYQILRWIRIKEKAVEYKGSKCTICDTSYPYPAMQFHHRDPNEKDVNWTKLRLRSWDKITHELDKCDLVCANCHSITHSSYVALSS